MVELKRVNINYLVHKYVNMIYNHKAKAEQGYLNWYFRLSILDFKDFVKLHPKIFEGLYKAFNFDVWGIDATTSVPRFMTVNKDLEGEL